MRHALLVLVCLVATLSATPDRFALVAGQNDGGATVEKLKFAESDARACVQLLQEHADFERDNVYFAGQPDSADLLDKITSISSKINALQHPDQAMFLFYYSGHADNEGLLLGKSHLSFAVLREKFSTIRSGVRIAIIDACQSGAVIAFKGGRSVAPLNFISQSKIRGEVWIASSSANEQAQESETLESSLFSFHLFSGLRGSADNSGDNRVTLNEAYQYAYHKTIETSALTSGIIQHPVYRFNISGEGDIILTDLSKKRGGILIDRTCSGSFLVLSRDYRQVYADFRKESTSEQFIALTDGEYTLINAKTGTDINLFQFSVNSSKTIHCSPRMFHKSLLQEARSKGLTQSNDHLAGRDVSRLPVVFIAFSAIVLPVIIALSTGIRK